MSSFMVCGKEVSEMENKGDQVDQKAREIVTYRIWAVALTNVVRYSNGDEIWKEGKNTNQMIYKTCYYNEN